jgi:hypothetical protein
MLYEDGKAKKVNVEITGRLDDQLEIASPELKGGEQLIIAGQSNLPDGALVEKVVE